MGGRARVERPAAAHLGGWPRVAESHVGLISGARLICRFHPWKLFCEGLAGL